MSITVEYPHHAVSGAPRPLSAETVWAIAAHVRRQAMAGQDGFALPLAALVAATRTVSANGRAILVAWELDHPVHDGAGEAVLGVCETDPDLPGTALVSVNARMVAGRPDLAVSTAAHELGHGGPGYDAKDRKLLVNDDEAALVRRIFEGFVETESGTKLVQALRAEGATTKRGRPFTKSDVYRVLSNRTYLGEAMHRGKSHPGEHAAIVPQSMWDAAHALLKISPRTRANRTRCQTPSLLRGLIFGSDGRAMSPTHARGRRGQQYRYYVSQSVLKGCAADGPAIARISAAEIEGAVIAQVRGLLRQPEVVLGAWRAARATAPDMTEDEARLALERLDPLWEELFPAEQARIIHLLVDRVDIGPGGADVRLRLEGLGSLARDLAAPAERARAAA